MHTLNCKGRIILAKYPLIMGIINATPDSFYSRDLLSGTESIISNVQKMIEDGADIIDIGGQSTKPGSKRISEQEEIDRVLPLVTQLVARFPQIIISVDTFYSKVAKAAVDAGALIINDVSAGNIDKNMLSTVAALNVPYVCMHMKGTPENMQLNPEYDNILEEVLQFFEQKLQACKSAGIEDVIIDPGFGFGKTVEQNFTLLRNLSVLSLTGKPILVGLSRKSMINKTLGITANDALNGTSVLNTLALQNGASILRVHDVLEAKQAITLFDAYKKAPLK
jgi:dihydropteroate synthase